MQRTGLIVLLSLSASLAHADLFESRLADGSISFSDSVTTFAGARRHDRVITHKLEAGSLPGNWSAQSPDGRTTRLTLRDDGSFVLDQRSELNNHRLYMCGTWRGVEQALDLHVTAKKRMLASGETEQAAGAYQSRADILSARRDRIILMIEGERLVFDRG